MFLPWSMMAMPKSEGARRMGLLDQPQGGASGRTLVVAAPAPFTVARFMSDLGEMRFGEVQPPAAATGSLSPRQRHLRRHQGGRRIPGGAWTCSGARPATCRSRPPPTRTSAPWKATMWWSTSPPSRPSFQKSDCSFWRAKKSSKPPPDPGVARRGGAGSSGARRSPSTYYPTPTTLVNTRRIGGPPAHRPARRRNRRRRRTRPSHDLLGAAKVTGQRGGWRYGLLTAFEDDVAPPRRAQWPAHPLGAGRPAIRRRPACCTKPVAKGAFPWGYLGTLTRYEEDEARVHGLDAHLLSRTGKITWDGQFMASNVAGQARLRRLHGPELHSQPGVAAPPVDGLRRQALGHLRPWLSTPQRQTAGSPTVVGSTAPKACSGCATARHPIRKPRAKRVGRSVRSGVFFRTGWMFKAVIKSTRSWPIFPPNGTTATALATAPTKSINAGPLNCPSARTPANP